MSSTPRLTRTGAAGALLIILTASSAAHAADVAFSRQNDSTGAAITYQAFGFSQSSYAGGATVGDFNRDGWQDLFILAGGFNDQPDKLFINNGDGTFSDQADDWGVALAHRGKGAATGDFNADGWLDLYVYTAGPMTEPAGGGHNILYRNNGDGTFTDVAAQAGVRDVNPNVDDSWTACFGDYDLDGDLDLFVGGFTIFSPTNNGNRLYRNNGDETFTDVTGQIGLFLGVPPTATLSAAFVDMNGDRYPELLVGADFEGSGAFGGSRYFQNNTDGTFTESADASNVGQEENGMGMCVGDVDNDGDLDWYVTSIYSSPTHWTGNKLYLNNGNHAYDEVSQAADVEDGGYGWGAVAVDFDHDGLVDLAETNGGQSGSFGNEQSYLWTNDGDGTFTERAVQAGIEHYDRGRTLINFDYDNDGDQDIIITTNSGPMHLYRNDLDRSQGDANWLRVFLDTRGWPGLAPHGFGATVTATVDGHQYTRSVNGGVSFLGISELSAHFGLNSHAAVEQLTVAWPDGSETVLADLDVNQTITINPDGIVGETNPCPADLDGDDDTVGVSDLLTLLSAWGDCADGDNCPADFDNDKTVGVADLLELLSAWGPCG